MKHFIIIITVSFLLGISWGGFGNPAYAYGDTYVKVWDSGSAISNPVYEVKIGDTDGDGKAEIIAADFFPSGSAKVYVFESTGDNSYQLVWDSGTMLMMRNCLIEVGDQDRDGKLEIIVVELEPNPPFNGKLHVFENNGDNSYQEVWNNGGTFNGITPCALFLGDADSDGKSEIIVGVGWGGANKGKIYVFENTGNDSYEEVWNSGSTLYDSVLRGAVGDLDKDGKKEIIVGSGDLDPQIHIFENTGDNSYALVWDSGNFFHRQMRISIGDGDKDGKEEIVAGSVDKRVCVFENAGDDIYQLTWSSPLMPHYMHFVCLGDQDNDGQREIIAPCLDKILYLFENTGDDTYEIVWDSGDILGGIAIQSVPGDVDGDGKGEIIVPCYDGKVYVFENLPPIITAVIDIKPGSWPNAINPRSKGVIPVAILTTDNFDATTVDPLSVKFGQGEAAEAHGKGHIEDVDNDGDLDLVLHFKTQETGIQHGDTETCLTGKTFEGKSINGCDTIVTKSKQKK